MSVLARAGWEALVRQVRGAFACSAARRIALGQPGVVAAEVARDDECPMLRLAVHLHVALGFDAAEVAARTQEAIRQGLLCHEVVVRVVEVGR